MKFMKCGSLILLLLLCFSVSYGLEYNISAPEELNVGEWFSVNVSVISEEESEFSVYSYVYEGFNCVGQGWITNQKEIHLEPNQTIEFELEDLIKHGTSEGFYNLRVRFRFDEENKIDETYTVKVVSNSEPVISETYLYMGLVLVSLTGLFIILRKG